MDEVLSQTIIGMEPAGGLKGVQKKRK
jgi:hypothetical protein